MAVKILLIEDDIFLRKVIKRKLLEEGYEFLEAVDGEEGIAKIREEKPDLVLLDLILPEMDGFEVLAKIKTDKTLPKIPIIILSNLGEKDNVEKGLKMGAVDYLVKAHFTPGEIIESIEKALNKSKK